MGCLGWQADGLHILSSTLLFLLLCVFLQILNSRSVWQHMVCVKTSSGEGSPISPQYTHTHTHIQNLLFALCLVLPRGYRGIQPLYQSCGIHEALELRCLFFCNHFDQLCTFFLVFIPKTVPGFSKLSGYLTNQTES